MIVIHEGSYNEYIDQFPSHAKFLNVKIDMYEELSIVCGNDQATGSYVKSLEDINDYSNEVVDLACDQEDEVTCATIDLTFQDRKHGKKSRPTEGLEQKIDMLSRQVGEVVAALKNPQQDQASSLYAEVMKSENFDKVFLASAFDYLMQHDRVAWSFMAKDKELRQLWLQKFQEDNC